MQGSKSEKIHIQSGIATPRVESLGIKPTFYAEICHKIRMQNKKYKAVVTHSFQTKGCMVLDHCECEDIYLRL